MKNKVINLFGNNKIIENKGVKYSKLLEQFMTPFEKELEDLEFFEDIIEFSASAWNFANMKTILPTKEENITSYLQEEDINHSLLIKMIAYKISHFKEYTNFIVDFEIEETDGLPVLTVITQEQDEYLTEMFEEIEEENEEEYQENFINRSAISIQPLKPFMDWVNTIYPEDKYEDDDFMLSTVYLVNDDIDDLDNWLRKKFDKFFMMELENFEFDKKKWPRKRNYKMFTEWFQVTVSISVFDTEKKPVFKSE